MSVRYAKLDPAAYYPRDAPVAVAYLDILRKSSIASP